MKILLVYPRSKSVYGLPHYPPLGIAYLATVLKEKGYLVEVLDMRLPKYNLPYLKKKLGQFKPDLVGVSSTSFDFPGAVTVFRTVKKVSPKIITLNGGSHASVCPQKAMGEKCLDYLIMGEGEETLPQLLKTISKKGNLSKIKGLVYRNKRQNGLMMNPPELIKNLNSLPFPEWNLFSLDEYRVRGKLTLPVASSRGCPFGCIYCVSWRTHGKQFRVRTPENVVDEIERDIVNYGAQRISFLDDNLTLDKKRIIRICQLVVKKQLKFKWTCDQGIRADMVDKDLLAIMKKSGCQLVAIGVESASQEVLDLMGKGESLSAIRKAIKEAKSVGLIVKAFFIVGGPTDNLGRTKESIRFFKENNVDFPRFGMMTAYPGSPLWDWVEKNGRWIGNPYRYILKTPTTSGGVQFETKDFPKKERLKAFALAQKEAEIWSIRQRLVKQLGPLLGWFFLLPFRLKFFRELVKKVYRWRLFSVTD